MGPVVHRQLLHVDLINTINPARRAHASLFNLSPMISDQQDCDLQWPAVIGPIRASMEAETDLRINSLRSTREAVLAFLREEGIECQATPFAPHGIRLNVRRSFGSLKSFRDGDFEPQGEASQLAVELLGLKAGQTVLDLCAGSGGKSLAAAACMRNRGRLILSDVNSCC